MYFQLTDTKSHFQRNQICHSWKFQKNVTFMKATVKELFLEYFEHWQAFRNKRVVFEETHMPMDVRALPWSHSSCYKGGPLSASGHEAEGCIFLKLLTSSLCFLSSPGKMGLGIFLFFPYHPPSLRFPSFILFLPRFFFFFLPNRNIIGNWLNHYKVL